MRIDKRNISSYIHESQKETQVRIGLYGMYASANLGDTAIQTVVMAALRSRRPDISFVGLSHNPEDIVRTYSIPGFPASGEGALVKPQTEQGIDNQPKTHSMLKHLPFTRHLFVLRTMLKHLPFTRYLLALRNIDRQMRDLDMLLISGGGQIDDFWGGPWVQPFRIFAWCMCARRNRKPIASFAVGVDELRGRLSSWFVVRALQTAQYRTFRDSGSLDILRDKGLNAAASVCPDPAFGYQLPFAKATKVRCLTKPRFAVISPISIHAFPAVNKAQYDVYLTALATIAEALFKQGIAVHFVCSQITMDPPVVSQVKARMTPDAGDVSFVDVKTVDDFVYAVRDAEFVIASRLHALILALVTGTPSIAISPGRKVKQQMIDLGLEEYCLDLDSLQSETLLLSVQKALAQGAEIRKHILLRVGKIKEKIKQSFDQLDTFIPVDP